MSSSLLTLLAILAIDFLTLTVSIVAWIRNPRNGFTPSFFVVALMGVFWATSNYYSYTTDNLALTASTTRLTLVGGLWLLLSICYFSFRFPSGAKPSSLIRWGILPAAIAGGLFSTSSWVISAITIKNHAVVITPGPLYIVYILLLVGVSGFALFILYRQYVHASLVGKNQIRYVSFGIGVAALGGIILNAILPIFYPTVGGAKVNLLLAVCFIVFVGYGLVRNRYIDIHTIGAKTTTYLGSFGLLVVVLGISKHLLDSHLQQPTDVINGIVVIAAALTLVVQPARVWLEQRVNRLVRRHWYNPEESFRRVAEILASEQRLDPLLQSSLDFLCTELGVTTGAFAITGEKDIAMEQQFSTTQNTAIRCSLDELKLLRHKSLVMLADDLPEGDPRRAIMEQHKLRMAAQLISGGKLVGFLLMGTKQSGDIFTRQDVRILNILSNQLAVAIVRSQGYEEISQFNSTLERKVDEATHELREAHEKLQADDRMKSEFIMLTSHNLRTPLAIINGYTDMIGDTPLNADQQKYFNNIIGSLGKLKQLVDDLLTIATLEGGEEFVHKPVTALEILEPLVDQMKLQMKDSAVQLSVIINVGDARLSANLLRTRAAFWNILDNAFKFTKTGTIAFEAEVAAGKLVVTITDTGIGIPSQELPTIFNKFHRASSTLQYDFDGEGIGLYLAKLIVDEHHGEIVVTSEPDKGTKVIISLPLVSALPVLDEAANNYKTT